MRPQNKHVELVTAILADQDPVGLIASGAPENEYYIEAFDIVQKLIDNKIVNVNDIQKTVFEVFVDSFTPQIAGPLSEYKSCAQQISDTMMEWGQGNDEAF